MTEVNETEQVALPEPPVPTKKRSFPVFSLLVLLLAAAAGGGAWWVWQQVKLFESRLDSMNEMHQQAIASLQASINSMNEHVEVQQQASAALDQRLSDVEALSQNALSLTQRGERGWILAEVDYLLRLAHRRLAISRDINGCIAALKGADERLFELGDLGLFDVRKQIAKDIGALNRVKQVDLNGAAMTLDQMVSTVDTLPFMSVEDEIHAQIKPADEAPSETETAKPGFVDSLLDTVMKMGDVRVQERAIQPARSALQQGEIEQRLTHHLLAARLAVLRQNQVQFGYDVKSAQQLLTDFYSQADNRVKQMTSQLTQLSELNLNPELPDITSSWQLLKRLLAKQAEKPGEAAHK